MAIQKELFSTRMDGVKLFRTYSDAGKMIIQTETGAILEEAVDVETANYNYTESAEPIPEHKEGQENAN